MDGNHAIECKRKSQPDCETDGVAETKVGVSDPRYVNGNAVAQRIKQILGITGRSSPKRPQRRGGLAPGCRLVTSLGLTWSWRVRLFADCWHASWVQNVAETVRSLSVVGEGYLKVSCPSVTRGRDGRTSGAPVVTPVAQLGSAMRIG